MYTTQEDREIRRKVHNRRYRRYDERYDYPYGNDYPYGYSPYSPVYTNPKFGSVPNPSQPRKYNLGAYKPNSATAPANQTNSKFGDVNSGSGNAPVKNF